MSVVGIISTASARLQVLLKGGMSKLAVASVLGAALWAQAIGVARPASADQIANVQAQANQLASEIASGSERIHALTDQYSQAQGQEATLAQEVGSASSNLARTRGQIHASYAELRKQAVEAYMEGSTAPAAMDALTSANPTDALLRQEYLIVANGSVRDTVDGLHSEEATLKVQQAQLESAQQAQQGVLSELARDRQSLVTQVSDEQGTLSQVQGQLSSLVAQAEQQRLAAMEAAKQRSASQGAVVAQAPAPGGGQPTSAGLATVVAPPPSVGTGAGDPFARIRQCESGDNYSEDTGNGYYGAYQISAATWASLGYSGLPNQAPPSVQDAAARALQARSGWGQWPTCAAMLGLI